MSYTSASPTPGEPLVAVQGPVGGNVSPPAQPTHSLQNDYDIDETDLVDDTSDATPVAAPAETPASANDYTPAGGRERNPDGTFKKAEHPRYLTRQARDLGFSDEELAELSTDQLGEAVYAANRTIQQTNLFNAQTRAKENHPGGQPQQVSVPDREEPQGESYFKMDPAIEAEFEPKFIGPIKSAFAAMQKELKELREQVGGVVRNEQVRETRSGIERLDACFQGDPDLFGKGTGARLQKLNPALFQKRLAVIAVMKSLDGGSVEERYQEAKEIIYGSQTAKPVEPEPQPAATVKQNWANAALARPTHRAGASEPPGKAKATKAVAAVLRELNGAMEGQDATVDDFPE